MKKTIVTTEGGFRAAMVDWEDAWSDGQGIYTEEELKKDSPFKIQSCGILVVNNKQGVYLAKQRFQNGNFKGILHIPKAMGRKVTLL